MSEVVNTPFGPKHLNRRWAIPYLAGYSKDGQTVYVHKDFPQYTTLKDGRVMDTLPFLIVHETTEKQLEDTKGYKYAYAHEQATGAERSAVEAAGYPWQEYQNYVLGQAHALRRQHLDQPLPSDYDAKPARDSHDYNLLRDIAQRERLGKSMTFLDKLIKAGNAAALSGGLAEKEGKTVKDFPPAKVAEGAKVEAEHTDNPEIAQKISVDHLTEDVDYYKKLKKIEKASFLEHLTYVSDILTKADVVLLCALSDDIIKGGEGSGVRGHTTARLPYPGEDTKNDSGFDPKAKSYVPNGGWDRVPAHDSKQMSAYKIFKKWLGSQGIRLEPSATFDVKTDKIVFRGRGQKLFDGMVEEAKRQAQKHQSENPKTPTA